MKKSALASVSFHALILLVALFGIPATKPFEIQPVEAIQVDISNITDNTKVKAQTKSDEKPVDKPKPKVSKSDVKTKPVEKVTDEKKVAAKEPAKIEPPPPEPEKKVEPPKPVEEKKVEDKPVDSDPLQQMLEAEDAKLKQAEEQKKKDEEKKQKAEAKKLKAEEEKKKQQEADAKAKADAKKKADAQKKLASKLDVAQLEDLLNKENDEASAPVEKKDEAGTPEKATKDIQGADDAMSATIIDGLRQRFAECWDIPPAVRESKETVKLSWQLSKQGKVVDQPVVVGGNGDVIAQQAAIAAVLACQPYDWLPQDGYHLWKEIEWTFAPR
jgi:TolA protein